MYKSATSDEIDFNRGSLTKNTAYFEVEAIFKDSPMLKEVKVESKRVI